MTHVSQLLQEAASYSIDLVNGGLISRLAAALRESRAANERLEGLRDSMIRDAAACPHCAQRDALVEALRPFDLLNAQLDKPEIPDAEMVVITMPIGKLRNAAKVLAQVGTPEHQEGRRSLDVGPD